MEKPAQIRPEGYMTMLWQSKLALTTKRSSRTCGLLQDKNRLAGLEKAKAKLIRTGLASVKTFRVKLARPSKCQNVQSQNRTKGQRLGSRNEVESQKPGQMLRTKGLKENSGSQTK